MKIDGRPRHPDVPRPSIPLVNGRPQALSIQDARRVFGEVEPPAEVRPAEAQRKRARRNPRKPREGIYVRLSPEMKAALARAASFSGVSLNALVVSSLATIAASFSH